MSLRWSSDNPINDTWDYKYAAPNGAAGRQLQVPSPSEGFGNSPESRDPDSFVHYSGEPNLNEEKPKPNFIRKPGNPQSGPRSKACRGRII